MEINQAHSIIVGVDEAGRGPLAGPVFAGAVILDPAKSIEGLTDSKKLSEKQRDSFFEKIMSHALAVGVGRAEVEEIDSINILQASLLAMQRAVASLAIFPTLALIDGNKSPHLACPTKTIIGGDLTEPAISAASIVAKVLRDREMLRLDAIYPHYGFAKHKGYPTAHHLTALKEHGVTIIHRKSFAPVKRAQDMIVTI